MMADTALPQPRYTIWQAITAALSLAMRAMEEVRELAARPMVPGPKGKDGLSCEDFSFEYDGERRLSIVYQVKGETRRFDIKLPIPLDAGVYKEGVQYEKGDGVSFGGSYFIAQEDTTDKPETSKAWRLSTKRGRDGKDGTVRQIGPPAPIKL